MDKKPVLGNIRVLDFTWVLAGPYGTRLLADFGAEVIKVQPLSSPGKTDEFEQGYYNTWNRNKLSITLDMSREEGLALARKLITVSDVVVENFTPRVMDNWGLTYKDMNQIKPDIIMVSMSAFGHTGSKSGYAGFAPTVQAASGLTGLITSPDGEPLGPGFSIADHIAGLYASIAILGALEHRRKTGKGQFIDISQQETMMSLFGGTFLGQQMSGGISPAPATEDLDIKNAADLFKDSLLKKRGFFPDLPDIGKLVDASPIRLSDTPAEYRKAAPAPDENNEYVFEKLLEINDNKDRA